MPFNFEALLFRELYLRMGLQAIVNLIAFWYMMSITVAFHFWNEG